MFSLSRALVAGAVLIASANAGDNFILTQVRTLEVARIDPLVTPGTNAKHVHNVVGGSNFGPNSGSPESLESSKCSSGLIGDDKSSYWVPQVYYNMGNGSYTPMIGSTRIYYFLKALNGTTPVVAFPRGLRMLAGGQPESRPDVFPPTGELSYDQLQAMDPRISAIKWGCAAGAVQGQGSGGSLPGQRPYLPNDAPNGCGVLNAGIFYPSCGDGRLDSDDHFSHMAYPTDGPEGYNCPASHSIKYPTMFLENFYFPADNQPYRGPNKDNYILSNGDATGLTFHADFINGWTPGVLEDVLTHCNAPNAPGADLGACAPLAKSLSVDNADNCRSQGDIVDEDVGLFAPINALPGCNPYWPANVKTKPTCKNADLPMGQPTGRYEVPTLKISLPIANSSSKVVAAPVGASNSQSYSYSTTSTTSSSSSSAAATTSASAAALTTDAASASSTSAAASSSSTSAAASNYAAESGSSSSLVVASSSSSVATSYAAAATGPASYSDPYGYNTPASSASSSAQASAAAAGAQASATSSSASAAAANASATSSSSDIYGNYPYYPPAVGSSTHSATASSPSTTASASVAAAPASPSSQPGSSSAAPYVAPAPGSPATTSTSASYVAPSGAAHPHPSPSGTKHMNPSGTKSPASSVSSSANATPSPQNANVSPSAKPPKKTCKPHRKHKNHGHRRRDRKRMIH